MHELCINCIMIVVSGEIEKRSERVSNMYILFENA